MSIRVLEPGLYTTVQDLGRYGSQKYGVIVSGAMDKYALRIANLLVGNEEGEGALEITLVGATLQFDQDQLIAITGGDLRATMDGEPVPMWRPVLVRKGAVLQCRSAVKGCRAYIAFAGGISVPEVMGSKSTYVRAGIGGFKGRPLQKDDMFASGDWSETGKRFTRQLEQTAEPCAWSVNPLALINDNRDQTIRVLKGSEYDRFDANSKHAFFHEAYTITTQADRMGYRLEGPALSLAEKFELLSEGVTYGTIQVPANGQPIILMADRQTTGGYPKIGQVITADLSRLAQLQPHTAIRFEEIRLEEAEAALLENERILHQMAVSIQMKAFH